MYGDGISKREGGEEHGTTSIERAVNSYPVAVVITFDLLHNAYYSVNSITIPSPAPSSVTFKSSNR